MKSGCICCTVRGEVADALLNLQDLRARGDIEFDRVVIETTGLADPYPVLQTLRAHPVLRSHFGNGGVLTTVDSVNIGAQLDHRAEAIRQIAAADRIVLTKTDLVDEAQVTSLRATLGQLNPTAHVLTGADDPATILGDLDPAMCNLAIASVAHDEHAHHHHHHHHHGHDLNADLGVVTFSLTVQEAVDWSDFGIWLTLLLHRYGDRIYRVKGILALEGEDRPVAVHGVQHLVHAPVHMTHWPDGPQVSRLVFILEGLEPERILRSFRAFMGLTQAEKVA
jgi:G3E family GTPase